MSKTKPHILFVEYDNGIRESFYLFYKQYDYGTIVTASCSEQALELLKQDHFDLVITGINQLEMDGLEMTAVICKLNGPPVIILTGWEYTEVRREVYKVGAMAYLHKPVPYEAIVKVARLVVEHGLHFIGPVEADTWKKEEFQWSL